MNISDVYNAPTNVDIIPPYTDYIPNIIPNIIQPPIIQPIIQPIVRKPKPKKSVTYKLGKNSDGTISVLIKNAPTRKRIRDEFSQLKQTPISKIRKYLKIKNLLKSGSNAPSDIYYSYYILLYKTHI